MDSNVYEVVECENLDGGKEDKEIDRKDTCYERDECVIYRKYNHYVSQVDNLLNKKHTFCLISYMNLVIRKYMIKIIIGLKYHRIWLMVLTNLHKPKHPSGI